MVQALLTSKHLERCRNQVQSAGQSLQPDWAGGAWVVLPMEEAALNEMLDGFSGLQLKPHHVILRARDERFLRAALDNLCEAPRVRVVRRQASSEQTEP